MRYREESLDDEVDSVSSQPNYMSNENAFIRYVTQLEPIPEVVDTSFLRRYRRRVLFSGKIKSLSFISNPRTIELNSCRRNNLSLAEDAGLERLADETVFDSIDDCQITRGTGGNLQYALITQKREFKDTSVNSKKSGWLRGMVKNENKEQEYNESLGGL